MAARDSRKRSSSKGKRPRILRIGLFLGETFIEERLVREQKPVTIGQSAKNVFSIPIEGMPRSWALLDRVDGGYVLRIHPKMTGRVTVGGKPRSLRSLKGEEAAPVDDHWVLPLSRKSRGKVELGEMKLLFQFVAPPPVQPRPRLPASVRGTFTDRIDPRLALILAISLMVHFGVALWAFQHDKVKERHAQVRLKKFREDRFKERTITLATRPALTTEAADGSATAVEKPARRSSSRPGGGGGSPSAGGDSGGGGPPSDAALREKFGRDPVLGVLGFGGSGPGRYENSEDVDQGTGLDKGMEELRKSGRGVAAFGSGDRKGAGPAGGEIAEDQSGGGIDGPRGGGSTQTKKEDRIPSRVSFEGIDEESDGTLDPNAVARKIQGRYRRGLQKCHERLLKINPRAGGRVQLKFTIGPTGRVTSARAKGFDSGVDACIMQQMRTWRFGTPKDEDGKPAQAKFSMPVMLKAGT